MNVQFFHVLIIDWKICKIEIISCYIILINLKYNTIKQRELVKVNLIILLFDYILQFKQTTRRLFDDLEIQS